jgi:hypothetical protein
MIGNIFQVLRYPKSGARAHNQMWPELQKYVFLAFIFTAGFLLYYFSIALSFEATRFLELFGNDHQWIIQRYHASSPKHHEHHILYHIIGRSVRHGVWNHLQIRDPVIAFKLVSALFGATGLVLFYFCILKLVLIRGVAQYFTVMFGISASYFFFSSTIDTYIPAAVTSILVMIFLINCLTNEKQSNYAYLGLAMGLAVLFRLDNVLLIPLAFIPIFQSRKMMLNSAYCLLGLTMGALAYILFAKYTYNVNYVDFFDWIFAPRVDTATRHLADLENFNLQDFLVVVKNHFLHSIIFESGFHNPGDQAIFAIGATVKNILTACFVAITLSFIALFAFKIFRNSIKITDVYRNVILILICWIVVRILFYLWFNPLQPFLFTVSTIAPVWILMTLVTVSIFETNPPNPFYFRYVLHFWMASLGLANFIFVVTELYIFE